MTKDEVKWIREQCSLYRSIIVQRLRIHELCEAAIELYDKLERERVVAEKLLWRRNNLAQRLEQANWDYADLLEKKMVMEQDLKETIKELKADKE